MFKGIHNRINWHSRKGRAVIAGAVCAAGLGIGLGTSGLLTQRAMAEPPTTYCLYSISIPPPPGCNAFHTCPVPYTGQYFYAVPSPPRDPSRRKSCVDFQFPNLAAEVTGEIARKAWRWPHGMLKIRKG